MVYVRYFSNTQYPHTGFKVKASIATCGGTFHLNQREVITIQSPNYPGNYANGDQCVWEIVGPEGHYLDFKFTDVAMPWSSNCSNVDHLAFFEQSMDSGAASGGDVNCGGHSASTCQDCPQVETVLTQFILLLLFSKLCPWLKPSYAQQCVLFLSGYVPNGQRRELSPQR